MRPAMLLLISCLLLLSSTFAQGIDELSPITPQNFEDLELLESIGKGWVVDADYSPILSAFAIGGSTGIWIYDIQTDRYTNHMTDFESVAYPIMQVLYSRDGTLLAGVFCQSHNQNGLCISSMIQLWDTQNYEEIFRIDPYPQVVYNLAFSPDSHTLAYIANGNLSIYDLVIQERIALLEVGSQTSDVSFSADGNRIVVASSNSVSVWSVSEEQEIAHFDIQSGASSVALNSDGTRVVAGLAGTIEIWDVDSLAHISSQTFDGDYIDELFFNQDDTGVIYLARYFPESQSEITIWDFNGTTTRYDVTGQVYSMNMLGDELAILQSDESMLRLIDYPSSTVRIELSGFFPEIESMAFHPNNYLLAVGYNGGTVRLWNINDYSLHSVIESDNQYFGTAITFDMPGERLAIAEGTSIRIWDVASQQTTSMLIGHTANVYALGFTQNGQNLISTSVDASIRIWDATTWEEIATFENSSCGRNISFSREQSRFAVSLWGCEGITIWDSNSFEIISEHNLSCCVTSLALHPALEIIVIGKEDGEIVTLNNESPSNFTLLLETQVSGIAFTTDGGIFVAGDLVVDFENQISFQLLGGQYMRISTTTFSPDDRILSLGSRDGIIRLFRIP